MLFYKENNLRDDTNLCDNITRVQPSRMHTTKNNKERKGKKKTHHEQATTIDNT
jgi:hypothetical protein